MACDDCTGKVVVDKDFYKFLTESSYIFKQEKPDFKPNPDLGEGKASEDELKYRKELQDELKKLYNKVVKAKDKDVKKLVDTYILNSQKTVQKNIDKIYDKSIETGIQQLKDAGIKKKKPKEDPEGKKALLEWQLFAVEKVGITIYYDIINARLSKRFFKTTYKE